MAGRLPNCSGCFLVGYDFTNDKDVSNMLIGQIDVKGNIKIINSFQGEEAKELFVKFITTYKV